MVATFVAAAGFSVSAANTFIIDVDDASRIKYQSGQTSASYVEYPLQNGENTITQTGPEDFVLTPRQGYLIESITAYEADGSVRTPHGWSYSSTDDSYKIYFLGSNKTFRAVLIVSDVWKGFGWGTIIYMAALTGVDPALYEAATIDGASRFQRTINITLPSIMPIIVLNLILSVPGILNAGFDQIFNLYNERVYKTADVLDTFIYRLGIQDSQYALSTAIGLVKSTIGSVLLMFSYWVANRTCGYKVF